MSYEGPSTVSSLADAFADIANGGRLSINSENRITDPNGYYDYDMNPYYWGAVMGYKGGLINMGSNGWYPDEIANGAQMLQTTNLQSRGSAGEFSFAFGFNIDNIFYFGASLDIQSISRKQNIIYDENISYGQGAQPDATAYPYQLRDFRFEQSMQLDGSGVGAKFGFVLRPVKSLRIGFAVHTPTYYSMAYSYIASLSSAALSAGNNPYGWDVIDGYVYAEELTPKLVDGGDNRWTFTTPTRLLAGLSYAFGPYAVISADYEYDAYRSLELDYAPTEPGYENADFRQNLKGVHSLRGGLEVKPAPWLALRVGAGYKSKVMRADYDFVRFSEPINDTSWYASAGIGFRLGKVTSIDFAYQYINSRYTDYYSFYTQLADVPNCSPLYGLDILKHNIALTFAFRF
jgi:long-subunit fatty acid transport protein